MNRALHGFLSAAGYFTVLPVGRAAAEAAPDADALSYLPLVGALAGALGGAGAWAVSLVAPHAVAVVAAFAFPVVLTGAIHIDGFLDSCDAVFATASPARRLEIFKDPAHGTFALTGMAILSALWLAVLWPLAPSHYPVLLAFTGATSRFAAIATTLIVPYARGGKPSRLALALSFILLLAASAYVWKWAFVVCILAVVFDVLLASMAARRLEGALVGDVYGFMIVVTEVLALLVLSVYA